MIPYPERQARPLGSVAVFRLPAIHCHPRRYHNETSRRLFLLPSWLQKWKRIIKVRTTCRCMAHPPTGETHHVRPVPPERSLFRRGPLSRRLPLALSIEERAQHLFQCRQYWRFYSRGGRFSASLPSCCNSFAMSDISGFGAGCSAVEITCRSKSVN